jgi:hypothetical protein
VQGYPGLIPWMLVGMKELKAENDALRGKLSAANDNQAKRIDALETEFKAYKAAHP